MKALSPSRSLTTVRHSCRREVFAVRGLAPSPLKGEGRGWELNAPPIPMPPAPREWGERSLNVRRWTEMPRGGHFAAMEVPDLLAEDIRTFFLTKIKYDHPTTTH